MAEVVILAIEGDHGLTRGYMSIGATGFEPAAFWSQTRRSTKLSYAPESATRTDYPDQSNA